LPLFGGSGYPVCLFRRRLRWLRTVRVSVYAAFLVQVQERFVGRTTQSIDSPRRKRRSVSRMRLSTNPTSCHANISACMLPPNGCSYPTEAGVATNVRRVPVGTVAARHRCDSSVPRFPPQRIAVDGWRGPFSGWHTCQRLRYPATYAAGASPSRTDYLVRRSHPNVSLMPAGNPTASFSWFSGSDLAPQKHKANEGPHLSGFGSGSKTIVGSTSSLRYQSLASVVPPVRFLIPSACSSDVVGVTLTTVSCR